MKKSILFLFCCMIYVVLHAQTPEEAAKYFKFEGGVQKLDKKVLKEPRATVVPYVAVRFNTGIMHHDAEGDKAFSKSRVDAYTWAYLEGLTDTDFQEITDDFQTYLESKMAAAGFTSVERSVLEANSTYQKEIEKLDDREMKFKDGSSYKVFTGQNRPYYKLGAAAASKMARNLKANVAVFQVELNFADLGLDIDKSYSVSSWEDAAYTYKERKLKYSAQSNIVPVLKLQMHEDAAKNMTITQVYEDYLGVGGSLKRPILSNAEFVAGITKEDVADKEQSTGSKLLRAINPDMTGIASTNTDSYTVKANPEQYKAAAKELLRKYADYIVITMSSYKK